MDTENIIDRLLELFPAAEKSELLEVLVACDGSVDQTTKLLEEQFGKVQQASFEDNSQKSLSVSCNHIEKHTVKALDASKRGIKREFSQISDGEVNLPHQTTLKQYGRNIGQMKLCKRPGKAVTLYTKEEVEKNLPDLVFVRDFLTKELASKLLSALVSKRAAFTHNKFYIAGQKCQSKHYTAIFRDLDASDTEKFIYRDSGKKNVQKFFTEMKLCAYAVEDKVNEVLSKRKPKSSYQIQKGWKANLCVSNLFQQEKQDLDWHSDKLTDIGPLPIIASISLGATRIFRVRKITAARNGGDSTIFNIPLPHNTLLVMLPGTQEKFKHCVPSVDGCLLDLHPVVGKVRYSLTFRMIRNELLSGRPKCPKCGSSMVLKRMFKRSETRGYYFWLCGSQYSGYKCRGFYYGKFDKINVPGEGLYTNRQSEATRWIGNSE